MHSYRPRSGAPRGSVRPNRLRSNRSETSVGFVDALTVRRRAEDTAWGTIDDRHRRDSPSFSVPIVISTASEYREHQHFFTAPQRAREASESPPRKRSVSLSGFPLTVNAVSSRCWSRNHSVRPGAADALRRRGRRLSRTRFRDPLLTDRIREVRNSEGPDARCSPV
jgi:hypothetical protein